MTQGGVPAVQDQAVAGGQDSLLGILSLEPICQALLVELIAYLLDVIIKYMYEWENS